jgi:ketosteroid isomerase-like protein
MTTTTDHPNVRTVHSMTEAVFSQDHDTLAKVFTDDLVFHLRGPHPMAGDHEGLGGFLSVLGSIFEMTGGQIDLDTKFCLATDGWAAEFEHATLGNKKGGTIESRNSFVYRFDGDRIAEMWMYLGVLPEVADAHFG